MKLNKLEFLAMNNPIRRSIQEQYELKILREMTSLRKPQLVLEIGCGSGNGCRLIKEYFSPSNIIGIDLDEKMVEKALKRTTDSSISYRVMDASHLDFPDQHFDAVFDFGIIHHIPNWKDCLGEISRVLKPSGELILEDMSIDSFANGIGGLWRLLSVHPYESMYTTEQFTDFLNEIGLTVVHFKKSNPLHLLKFFSLTAVKTR